MKKIEIENIKVFYNDYKIENNKELNDFLKSNKFNNFLKNLSKDIVVILGGDGSFLEIIQKQYKSKKKFLGINFGTKGFLLNKKNIIDTKKQLIETKYNLLECSIGEKKVICFNELDIKAGEGKMIELDIKVNNSHKLNIIGDGIIISTPAGSTGYNHSLCGPILPHNLNAFVITPKAPWKPKFQSPIILDDEIIVNILNTGRINPIEIYSDGVLVKNFKDESINLKIKKSKYKITLLSSKETNDNFDNKVLEEQGFINL